MLYIEDVKKPHFVIKKCEHGTMENDVTCFVAFGNESISAASAQPNIMDVPNASFSVALGTCATIDHSLWYIKFIAVSRGKHTPNRNSGTFVSPLKLIKLSASRTRLGDRILVVDSSWLLALLEDL